MKVVDVSLKPLPNKHYSTDLTVTFDSGETFDVEISGYGSTPSQREVDNGWEPDFGMNHVESEGHLFLAQKIKETFSNA